MFYATYKNIGDTDIAMFNTEQERDEWVNFQDELSKFTKTTKDNCTFERMALDAEQVEERIESIACTADDYNPNIRWFILS